MYTKTKLAPSTVGLNVTHPGVALTSENIKSIGLGLNITTVGAGPTLTYKFQASFDKGDVADADSQWFDVNVTPAAAEVPVATETKTALGYNAYFLDPRRVGACHKIRLVTSANTNVTYEADLVTR